MPTIKVGEAEHLIPPGDSRLHLIFTDPDLWDIDLEYADPEGAFVLDPEVTKFHGARVQQLDERTLDLVHMIIDQPWPQNSEHRSLVTQHLIGLVDLTLKLSDKGIGTLVWKHPETHLHPKHQANMADMVRCIHKILSHEEDYPNETEE